MILQSGGGGGGFFREREDANRDNKSVPPPPLAPTPFFIRPVAFFPTPFSFKARLRCREGLLFRQQRPCQPVRMRTRPQNSQKKRDALLAFRPRPREGGGGEQKKVAFFSSSSSLLFFALSLLRRRGRGKGKGREKKPLSFFSLLKTRREKGKKGRVIGGV